MLTHVCIYMCIGVEPARIPTMSLACKHPTGQIDVHPPVNTIADGINVSVCIVYTCMCEYYCGWN